MKAKLPAIIKWHRRLAIIAASAFLLWAGSGLLHPVMTWTNPRPAFFVPPASAEFSMPSLPEIKSALQKNGIPGIQSLRVMSTGQIQVTLPGQPARLYIDLKSGQIVPDADPDRAVSLARHYSGATEPVRNIALITEFSDAYPYINRFLPAWRIDFARPDGLSLYVETQTDRLGSITDTQKFILQTIFQSIHTWTFLNNAEGLRLGIILCLVGSILSMSGFGLSLLIFMKRPNGTKGQRNWHRKLALIAWLPLIVFPASGLFHLIVQSRLLYPYEDVPRNIIAVDSIPAPPNGTMQGASLLLMPDGSPYWWTPDAQPDLIRTLARQFAGEIDILSLTEIKNFSSEYAFAYKRLPVWRAEFKNGVYFIEPSTATLSAKTSGLGTAENWTFSTFHKWQFLDPYMGKIGRDILMITIILIGMGTALTGLLIFFKKSR